MRKQSLINLLNFGNYTTSSENASILSEALYILCEDDEDKKEDDVNTARKNVVANQAKREKRKKTVDMVKRAAIRIAAGALLGAGAGATANSITKAAAGHGIAGASNGLAAGVGAAGGAALGTGSAYYSDSKDKKEDIEKKEKLFLKLDAKKDRTAEEEDKYQELKKFFDNTEEKDD